MIVLDGSALFAILLDEPGRQACVDAIADADDILISAGSLAELLIVAAGKNVSEKMEAFLALLEPSIVSLTADRARAAADAYCRWGKGFHPAALNFGDSFAYALAIEQDCPLLFVGEDFAKTDVTVVSG